MGRYKLPFNQYKACMKMSQNEFSRWLGMFADEMHRQGYNEACKDIPEGSIVIKDKDEFSQLLLSVPGIGPKVCKKIINLLYGGQHNE